MGLFDAKKLVGTIKIRFYGEDKTSVIYNTNIINQKLINNNKVQLFAMYYAKILYNLNKGQRADLLIDLIQKITKESMKQAFVVNKKTGELGMVKSKIKQLNILGSGQILINSKLKQATNTYAGELYQKSNDSLTIKTYMGHGGEEYYAPVSVTMFLQYLINSLPESTLLYLMVALNFMNKYYQEMGKYYKVRSIIDAPTFGFDSASTLFNRDKKNKA